MFEIGNTLREARLRRGLDIAECEAETKIRAKYLRALEEEEFDLLPAPSYVRGFLRTYAEYLGLDGQLVLDEYNSRMVPPREVRELERAVRGRRSTRRERRAQTPGGKRRRTEIRLLWLAIGGVMATALLLWMGAVNGHDSGPTVPPPEKPTATGASIDTTATSTAPLTTTAPVDERFTVAMTGTGTTGSWLQVQALHRGGKVLYENTLAPGVSIAFKARRSVWVRVGSTAGVSISVNGVAQTLQGGTSDFLVTRNGLRPG
jgi:cytoskeleton protein RodZ